MTEMMPRTSSKSLPRPDAIPPVYVKESIISSTSITEISAAFVTISSISPHCSTGLSNTVARLTANVVAVSISRSLPPANFNIDSTASDFNISSADIPDLTSAVCAYDTSYTVFNDPVPFGPTVPSVRACCFNFAESSKNFCCASVVLPYSVAIAPMVFACCCSSAEKLFMASLVKL